MSYLSDLAERLAGAIRRTPLHPQWLLGTQGRAADWIRAEARGRVLDIGCADRWIEVNLPQGCEYIGLDYPPTGRDLYGSRPDVFADAGRLPLTDACIDTVLVIEVLEHLRQPTEALREISRVLRPHGKMLLSVPFLYPIHDAPHDYQRLTRYGLVRDVEAAGLRVDSLVQTLGSAETAGLMGCLALGGMSITLVRRPGAGLLLVPFFVAAIPVINLLSWICGRLSPAWEPLTAGYRLVAVRN